LKAPDRTVTRRDFTAGVVDLERTFTVEVLAEGDFAVGIGLVAETATDGHDALRKVGLADANGKPFDLILLDCAMPGLDSVQCAHLLSQREHLHPVSTMLMVGAASRDEVQKSLTERELGVGALLTKPITPSALFEACSRALGLPVARTARTTEREEASLDHQTRLRGAQILLVEDNAINREIALAVLRRAGLVVSVAYDGQEALAMLGEQHFDGVLMDCQMPVMDGYAATRALRQRPQWRDLPVIAMTANALVGDRDKVLAAGMNDHIAKPIKVDQLFATLARWVRPARSGPGGTHGSAKER